MGTGIGSRVSCHPSCTRRQTRDVVTRFQRERIIPKERGDYEKTQNRRDELGRLVPSLSIEIFC